MRESFGQWVRLRRKQRQLTQKALGKLIGYAEITVRQIESNTYKLSPFIVECLVNCLAVQDDDPGAITRFALNQPIDSSINSSSHTSATHQSPFFGRQNELKEISVLLASPDCRCISIIGVGGVGKTRLADLAVTSIPSGTFQEIGFVNLTRATTTEQMARLIAETVGIGITPFRSTIEQLLLAIAAKDLLLVLDNFEQLLPQGVGFLKAVLEQSPRTKVIVTTRERLQIKGEWSIRLHGLGMTDESPLSDAVDLFVSTARRLNNRFAPSDIDEILAICRLLQGLPLAIEMAASWTGVYTCSEILNTVTHTSLQLTSRYQDDGERHRSLQAVFEATWTRLSALEQLALMRLAIFHGSISIEAALRVAAADDNILALLEEKMLVNRQNDNRLVLHEMIHQLALQKLVQNEAEWHYATNVHADYFITLFSTSAQHIKYGDAREAILHISCELENIAAAWKTLLEERRTDWFELCWEGMWLFFNISSRFREGEDWFRAVVDTFANSPDTNEKLTADFNRVLVANFLLRQGRITEAHVIVSNPQLETVCNSPKVRDRYLFYFVQSYVLHALGNAQAARLSGEVGLKDAKFFEQDPYFLITGYYQMGRVHLLLGDSETAYRYLSSALQLYREYKLGWGMGLVLTELGLVAEAMGRITDALAYYEAVLAAVTEWEEIWNYHRTRINIGRVKLALGETQEAISIFCATLQGLLSNPQLGLEIDCFVEVALVLKSLDEPSWARLLLEYCAVHPECFQPVRDRATDYLKKLTAELPDQNVSAARNLFPVNKRDVCNMLLKRLDLIQQNLSQL